MPITQADTNRLIFMDCSGQKVGTAKFTVNLLISNDVDGKGTGLVYFYRSARQHKGLITVRSGHPD